MGALPNVQAASDNDAKSGDFFGPDGMFHMRGYPLVQDSDEMSHLERMAKEP